MPLWVHGYLASGRRADDLAAAGLGSNALGRGSGPRPTHGVLAFSLSGAAIPRRSSPRALEGASST
jgi:hypothetical protein